MENNNKIFPILSNLINKSLDKEIKLTRVELAEYLNNTLQSNSDKITDIDIHIDEIIKSYYEMYASTDQKKFIEKSFIKSKFDTERIIDPSVINIKPLTLDIYNTKQQSELIDQHIDDLLNKTKKIIIEDYNNIVHLAENKVANFVENEVFFSLSGKKRVDAAKKHAENVFETYSEIITAHLEIKNNIQQFFKYFSELRDNLRYFREDFYYIIQLHLGADLTEEELKLLSFDEIKWLEYDKIQDRLDLKYDEIQEKCSTFYLLNTEAVNNIINTAGGEINRIFDKASTHNNYNKSNFKNDLITAGIKTGIDTILNLFETNNEANKTIADLRKETELVKQFFFDDKLALQQDVFRLVELYNEIKNIFIPITKEFKDLLFKIINDDYTYLFKDEKLKSLINTRKESIQKRKELNIILKDKLNISKELYEISSTKKRELDNYRPHYEFTLEQKPEEPNTKTKLKTLGYCTIYYPYYYNLWDAAYQKVKKNYDAFYTTYKEKNRIYTQNEQILNNFKTKITIINSEIKSTEEELKDYIKNNNSEITLTLKSKIKELVKIAETSKLVLEQTIQEKLKDPKVYKESVSVLSNFIEQNKIKFIDIVENEIQNESLNIDQIISYAKNYSTFNKVTEQFVDKIARNYPNINKELFIDKINLLGTKFKLDTYDLEAYRDSFINYIITNTNYKGEEVVNHLQITQIGNIAIQYFKTAAEVHSLNKETEVLIRSNKENQINLDEHLRKISKNTRAEIDKKLEHTKHLFNELNNNSLNTDQKMNLFSDFLKK